MFHKLLIANRGEIACRVIDTCRRLGVATVAVYSDADRAARHVAMADGAVHIGGALPAESYLRGDKIIQAALETGAEAVHPGYGFLSENPDFVEAVETAGLVFVGPSAKAIRAMGLKDAAKALMEEAGVPVVAGYHGADQDAALLATEAQKIGYPVLIKAVAGGGGKGMRLVEAAKGFADALASARAEAMGAFGNDAVLIEKFVEKPRHIEVQVFGDGTDAVHLFERDCSLQRRHQKVIEEAPAPGMTPGMREAMGRAAVRAAAAIGYKGAGTIEFIVDASEGLRPDRFWFMEMNTRLQVEHPVTEAITGVDLVEWQLRVASGEALPMRQAELTLTGHAFEARLYAEDVPRGFLPSTGTLTHLKFPHGARADTGVRAGDRISPYYDPMIAKIVVHGATREIALSQLRRAITGTEVAGTVTNLTFLGKLAADPDFSTGDVDTGLIGRKLTHFQAVDPPPGRIRALAAVAAAGLKGAGGFTLWDPLERTIHVDGDTPFTAILQVYGPGRARVLLDGEVFELTRGPEGWSDGHPGRALRIGDSVSVFAEQTWSFDIPDPFAVNSAVAGGNLIDAPMPGLVKAVFAEPGQKVSAGDRLAVLEAMKMEHALAAPRDGVIADVLVKAGDQVEAGAALVRLKDEAE